MAENGSRKRSSVRENTMKKIILFLTLICGFCGCGPEPTNHPQIYPNPNIGNNLSMPQKHQNDIIFAEKDNVFITGRENEGIPTILVGIKF